MKEQAIKWLHNIFDIQDGGEMKEKVIENIRKNIEFKGASLLTLIFAIFIASIGLNINSIAIIIGAMLISPLMSPIVGLGLAVGIQDSKLVHSSLRNLARATIMGIIISTLYFFISPISNVQSELLARTSPTIYDVLIAFFGGLAGIVGATRAEKGNVIPGVAIATALMPPLCTVGYGIATLQPQFIFGAFYLFAINCIFICLATLVGVKYLKLPIVAYIDEEQKTKTRRIISTIVVIMIVPAIFFAYNFVGSNKFNQNSERFIRDSFTNNGSILIYKNIDFKSRPHKIELAFLSKHFSQEEISDLKSKLSDYGIKDTELIIKQDNASLTEDEWNSAIANIQSESEKIKAIEAKISGGFINIDNTPQILQEAQSINQRVQKIGIGNIALANDTAVPSNPDFSTTTLPVQTAVFYMSGTSTESVKAEEEKTLTTWIKSRLQNPSLLIIFTPVI